MAVMSFKQEYDFLWRRAEAFRVRVKYPDKLPLIVEKSEKSDIPNIIRRKYLVPYNFTVGQLVYVIRKRVKLDSKKAIFVFIGNVLPSSETRISTLYKEKRDEDGFLYVTYRGENTFGGMILH